MIKRSLARIATLILLSFALAGAGTLSSCGGKNALESQAPENLQQSAESDMESGEYKSAQVKLKKLLKSEKKNYPARSLLAASYAAQGGVILLRVIAKMATTAGESAGAGGQSSPFVMLSGIFPDESQEAIDFIIQAVDEMKKIPTAKLTSEMRYQKGIFELGRGMILLKHVQAMTDPLGEMTDAEADMAVQSFTDALATLGSDGVGEVIGTLTTSISATPGSSNREKLATWVQASGQN